ncbi:MAG: VCBS repeat-containing protein, partial [Myxococcota bacterium]
VSVSAEKSPSPLAIVDVDGDDAVDLLGAEFVLRRTDPFLLTFDDPFPYFRFDPSVVAIGRVNDDNTLDALHDGPGLFVRYNGGVVPFDDASVRVEFDTALPFEPALHRVADLNLDGFDDSVVLAVDGQSIAVTLGNGFGDFSALTDTLPLSDLTGANGDIDEMQIGDVNGDFYPDIVVVESGLGVVTYAGDGTGGFSLLGERAEPGARDVTLGDANGDGSTDVIVLTDSNYVVYDQIDGALEATPTRCPVSGTPRRLHAHYLEADSALDLIVTIDGTRVVAYRGPLDGCPTGSLGGTDAGNPSTVKPKVADRDLDGRDEIFHARSSDLYRCETLGTALLCGSSAFGGAGELRELDFADIGGNGELDLATSTTETGAELFSNFRLDPDAAFVVPPGGDDGEEQLIQFADANGDTLWDYYLSTERNRIVQSLGQLRSTGISRVYPLAGDRAVGAIARSGMDRFGEPYATPTLSIGRAGAVPGTEIRDWEQELRRQIDVDNRIVPMTDWWWVAGDVQLTTVTTSDGTTRTRVREVFFDGANRAALDLTADPARGVSVAVPLRTGVSSTLLAEPETWVLYRYATNPLRASEVALNPPPAGDDPTTLLPQGAGSDRPILVDRGTFSTVVFDAEGNLDTGNVSRFIVDQTTEPPTLRFVTDRLGVFRLYSVR